MVFVRFLPSTFEVSVKRASGMLSLRCSRIATFGVVALTSVSGLDCGLFFFFCFLIPSSDSSLYSSSSSSSSLSSPNQSDESSPSSSSSSSSTDSFSLSPFVESSLLVMFTKYRPTVFRAPRVSVIRLIADDDNILLPPLSSVSCLRFRLTSVGSM